MSAGLKMLLKSKGKVSEHMVQDRCPEILVLTCGQRSGIEPAEVVVQPVVVPVPPTPVPVEIANVEAAIREAVDRTPEEDRLFFPLFGDKVRVGEQVIEHVRRQDDLSHKLLAEFVAFNPLLARGLFLREIERFRLCFTVPFQRAAEARFDLLFRRQDRPAIGAERSEGAVGDVLHQFDFGLSAQEGQDFTATLFALGECVKVRDFPASFG